MEGLGRASKSPAAQVTSTGLLDDRFGPTDLGRTISDFLCALDAVREGAVAGTRAEIPSDPQERSNHLKAAGYFLDATLMGVAPLKPEHLLPSPHQHPKLASLSFTASKEKLNLRFNPALVIRQMEQALTLGRQPMSDHRYALVVINDYPRDPGPDEPGTEWFRSLQPWRAAVRAAESACVLASYLRILGYAARAHTATTSNVNLHKLAVEAGLALPARDGRPTRDERAARHGIANPFIGNRFEVAVVTTTLELAPDAPLREQTLRDRWRAKGPRWWLGAAAPRSPRTAVDMTGRPYKDSRY